MILYVFRLAESIGNIIFFLAPIIWENLRVIHVWCAALCALGVLQTYTQIGFYFTRNYIFSMLTKGRSVYAIPPTKATLLRQKILHY